MTGNEFSVNQIGIIFYHKENGKGCFIPFNSINSIEFEPNKIGIYFGHKSGSISRRPKHNKKIC